MVRQVRGNGLLLGLGLQSPDPEQDTRWWARELRSQLFERGVWAISDREENLRLYPALTMAEATLREGLDLLEDAIDHLERHGLTVGDAPRLPTGL